MDVISKTPTCFAEMFWTVKRETGIDTEGDRGTIGVYPNRSNIPSLPYVVLYGERLGETASCPVD